MSRFCLAGSPHPGSPPERGPDAPGRSQAAVHPGVAVLTGIRPHLLPCQVITVFPCLSFVHLYYLFVYLFICLFRAAPAAYGRSQASVESQLQLLA